MENWSLGKLLSEQIMNAEFCLKMKLGCLGRKNSPERDTLEGIQSVVEELFKYGLIYFITILKCFISSWSLI